MSVFLDECGTNRNLVEPGAPTPRPAAPSRGIFFTRTPERKTISGQLLPVSHGVQISTALACARSAPSLLLLTLFVCETCQIKINIDKILRGSGLGYFNRIFFMVSGRHFFTD